MDKDKELTGNNPDDINTKEDKNESLPSLDDGSSEHCGTRMDAGGGGELKEITTPTEDNTVKVKKDDERFRNIDKDAISAPPEHILLLEDSTLEEVPKYVDNVLSKLVNRNETSSSDYLAALIYCIALESGFFAYSLGSTPSSITPSSSTVMPPSGTSTPQTTYRLSDLAKKSLPSTDENRIQTSNTDDNIDNNDSDNRLSLCSSFWGYTFNKRNILQLAELPEEYCFKKDTLYKFKMKLLTFSERKCILLCFKTGDSMCVTFSPDGNLPGKSIYLSISRYVLLMNNSKLLAGKLRNLKELSFLLKENIFTPTRNSLMEEGGYYYPGLLGIPEEVLITLIRKMPIKDLQTLSKSCTKLRKFCVDSFKKRFPNIADKALARRHAPKRSLCIMRETEPSEMSIDIFY